MVAILAGVGIVRAAGIIVTNDRPSPTPFPLPAGGSIPDGPGAFPNNDGILDRILDFGRRMGGFGEGPNEDLAERIPGFGEGVTTDDLATYIFYIEVVIPASSYEEARNIALEKMGEIDPATRTPYYGRLGVGRNRIVGFDTRPNGVYKRFRLDWDPTKGPHINVTVGRRGTKADYAITFPGTEADVAREYDRLER
jgi:hypothetical protein